MAISTVELEDKCFALVPNVLSEAEAYGRWNALVAFDEDGTPLDWVRAHDGDFFPESYRDYEDEIRKRRFQPGYSGHPIRVDIDITQVCNAKCIFCFSRPYQTADYHGVSMGSADLRKVIREFAERGTKTIRYCGGGEPLMHPEIEELLEFPGEFGLKLSLITNGDFFDRPICEKLVASVDNLHWSVNAATDQTRVKLHRPGIGSNQLSESNRWIRWIGDAAKHRPSERPMLIWATYLLLPENINEIVTATLQMQDLGVKSISFRPVYHGLHSKWTPAMIEQCKTALKDARKFADPPNFYVFTTSRNPAVDDNLNPNDFFSYCFSRELRTVMESTQDGMQFQSCGQYRGNPETSHGLDHGVNGFIHSWKDFMSKPSPRRAPGDCRNCIDVSMNVSLSFIDRMLSMNHSVTFVRAMLEGQGEWGGNCM